MILTLWNFIIEIMIKLFGEEGKILTIIVAFILIDLITGILASAKNGMKISSMKANEGIQGKIGLILSIMFGYLCDVFVNIITTYEWLPFSVPKIFVFGSLVSVYVAINEAISIIENLNCINPKLVPKKLRNFFENANTKFNQESGESDYGN